MTRRLLALAALVALAGCSLDKQGAPALAGPSETGLSLAISATPDIITQDGASQALIEVVARDANGQPVRGLSLRLETAVGNTVADIGSLSARTVSTNNDGRASATFVSPPPPPPTVGFDTFIEIHVTPIGSNYQNTSTRSVGLRLARPVNTPPNGAPRAVFFFSPGTPKTGEDVLFDGSASTDDEQIVSYVWNFGDGSMGSGQRVQHDYAIAGNFNVTLTVTDNRGGTDTSAPQAVSVGANTAPTARFTFSPTAIKVGTSVSFNAAQSTAALGRNIVAWDWDFGDGTPHGSGETPFHTYAAAGSYTVTLVVTDSAGQKNATALTITITP
jgi:PKD repeat protein